MGTYRLTENAKSDLKRIYTRGLREYGEVQADHYYNDFFKRFEQLAKQPLSYPAVDHIRAWYRRSVCGTDSIYYRVLGEAVEIMAIIGQQGRISLTGCEKANSIWFSISLGLSPYLHRELKIQPNF